MKININFHASSQADFDREMKNVGQIIKGKKQLTSHLKEGTKNSPFVEFIKSILSKLPLVNLSRTNTKAITRSFVKYAKQNPEYLKNDKNFHNLEKKFFKLQEYILNQPIQKEPKLQKAQEKMFEAALKEIRDVGLKVRQNKISGLRGGITQDPLPRSSRLEHKEMTEIFKQGVEKLDDLQAYKHLARAYYEGIGIRKDVPKALELYEKIAEKENNPFYLTKIGKLYEFGEEIPQSYPLAAEYYKKAAASDNGEAFYRLALLYQDGKGVPQSKEIAQDYKNKAKEKGYTNAINFSGLLVFSQQADYQRIKKALNEAK